MSWLFSKALMAAYESSHSSPERAAASSEENSWDGEPFAQLNVMPTQHKFWRNDKTMEFSNLSRFGLTCAVLTESCGEELLTWFRAGFLARTLALPERASASQAHARECGLKWRASLAKYDPASHSWKTAQLSLLADSELSSLTWPRSGMTAGGECWELSMLEPIISETGSGLSLPTPSASHCETRPAKTWNQKSQSGRSLGCMAATGMWPTPTCPNGGRSVAHVTDWRSERTAYSAKGKKVQIDLAAAVRRWPTPTAHNAKETNAPSESERNTPTLAAQAGGALNPTWVELLMGWPKGWTDVQTLDRGEIHEWEKGFSGQNVRDVRDRIQSQANAEREVAGREAVSGSEALQLGMREYQEDTEAAELFVAGEEVSQKRMRGVRVHEKACGASLRPKSDEQRSVQSSDALQSLSRLLAYYGQEAWQSGRWEDAVPRVAKDVAHRVDRLKAIGNGQVPLCAATAFRLLSGE